MGRNDWEPARVADAYKACIGKKFKLFMMFDMASMPCSSPEHGDPIRKMITDYDGHSNQLKYQGKTLVSTFGGQFCTFGKSRMDEGWSQVMKTNLVDVHFCPAFFISPPVLPSLKAIDGAFSVSLITTHWLTTFSCRPSSGTQRGQWEITTPTPSTMTNI